jgi:hypothetical protein
MKNYFFILFFIILFGGCTRKSTLKNNSIKNTDLYTINKITSINNYFIIYAERNDSLFKIVSTKENVPNGENIHKNSSYALNLISILKNRQINGINIMYSVHVTCFAFDNKTNICIEPKKGIYDLYRADNLRGLCIHK